MKKTILSLCCVAALVACKKETIEGPQGPAGANGANGTVPSGSFTGKVKQYDQYATQYSTTLNTTTVSVEGTNLSTVTDASGNYTISNVPPGIYDLNYSKPGAGLFKMKQVAFPGNGSLYHSIEVADKPSYTLSVGYVKDSVLGSNPTVKYNLSFTPLNKNRSIALVFGKTANIDLGDISTFDAVYSVYATANSSSAASYIQLTSNTFSEFASGSVVYVKVYPTSLSHEGYYDPISDRNIYTNYGTPLATTFTVTKP